MGRNACARGVLASSLALVLGACGGGGGSKSNPPLSPPPTTPPTTPPPTTPPPPIPQPAMDAHLALTNARDAHASGYNGAGVRIGIVDSGVMRNHPALAGRVVANYFYLDPARNNANIDDVVGHGTAVAELAAGAAVGSWPGGIAPGAQIVSARIISDTPPTDDGSGQGNEVDGALGFAPIHDDLIRAGVRIMNNSWGGLYWSKPTATGPIASEYRPFIIDNDGLVVFATGNESRADPSNMAALPSQPGPNGTLPAADLERGWLAVAALDTANPTQLASYSNACGVAKNYCLVAPGTAAFVSPQSTAGNLSYLYNSGTSFSAPLVSGAAALVWQAFPYFNNDLVRQTLLGTATDLGVPGPDAQFGYGLLNIGKAVKGPAKFDWGDAVVNVNQFGLESVWGNDISGSGGLVKQGEAALSLSGNNTYSGATRIERGTLALRDGGSIRSNVTITPQSDPSAAALQFLNGDTRVVGNVDNGASVLLLGADSSGTIEGNYVQRAGGQLMIALGAKALQVSGTATLDGGVMINGIVNGFVAQDGKRQDLIHAGGGVSGIFATPATVTQNTGLSLLQSHYDYDPNNAWLILDQVSVISAARSAGLGIQAMSVAQRVEQAFELLNGDIALQGSTFGAAAAAVQQVGGGFNGLGSSLESLSGKAHAAATAMTFDSVDMNRRALSAQFADASAGPLQGRSWTRALGGGGQGGYLGSDYNVGGWMMGGEAAIAGNGVLGFAFGETRANTTAGVAQDRSRDRQTQSQLYAGWRMGDAYVLGQAGLGQYQRELDRGLLLGSERAGVHSRYSGNFLSGSVESGYRLGHGAATLTPYLGAEYTRIDNDAFREQGGYGFGLRADDWSSSRTQALAGLRGQYLWKRFTFNGYAEWQQTLDGSGLTLDAGFVGVDAWAPLAGLQPSRSGGLLGMSADAWLSRKTRLSLGYDQRFGPRGDNRQVSLRLQREL
ncbi:S8 family serine peptidase [Stenotrophomonas humi]